MILRQCGPENEFKQLEIGYVTDEEVKDKKYLFIRGTYCIKCVVYNKLLKM